MERRSDLNEFAKISLAALSASSLARTLTETTVHQGQTATRDHTQLISFSSNDYLGLSQDQRVKTAAAQAAQQFGAGAGASRLVTGNHPLFAALEHRIATFKGTEAALVFGSGYLANIGVIPTLASAGDLILIDELAHACQIAGAKLSKATVVIFKHNDMDDLQCLLRHHRATVRHCLIVSEGVFSMDGDLAPLPKLVDIACRWRAWTLIDDAHALGVIGNGRGSAAHWGVAPDVQMGTLSKAAGSYGGYIAADQSVVDLLISRAKSFIFATGLPPASAAAADKALEIMSSNEQLCAQPVSNAAAFCEIAGLGAPQSCIVPIIIGSATRALDASNVLLNEGFLVTAIRPPTVPDGTARLRFTFAADHNIGDIERLARIVRTKILPMKAA